MSSGLKISIYPFLSFLFGFIFFGYNSVYGQDHGETSFPKMGSQTPNYQVVKRVIMSNRLKLRRHYSDQEWSKGHYKGSWKKVGEYFPKRFYYNSSTKYFMSHSFTAKGKMKMDIYQSKELKNAVANLNKFYHYNIVNYYKKIKKDGNSAAIKDFEEKLGLLASYFESKSGQKLLKSYLEKKLYNELLKELREEGDHMFAAALLHEGMHAKIGNGGRSAEIQDDFKTCKTPVQWDELRGYMSEVGYHSKYFDWSKANINGHMGAIFKLLKDLEKFRGKKKPLKKSEKKAIEKIKTKIKAHIAIIRVRLREMKQSLDRMKGLMDYFKKNYVKDKAPPKYKKMIDGLEKKILDFEKEAKKAIESYEKALKDLEDMLKAWNEWAACKTKTPPLPEKHKELVKKFKDISWPSSPPTADEKEEAEKRLAKIYVVGPYSEGDDSSTSNSENYKSVEKTKDTTLFNDHSSKSFEISAGISFNNHDMGALNSYFTYLNDTWTGNIAPIEGKTGYWLKGTYAISESVSMGLEYVHSNANSSGILKNQGSFYRSESSYNGLMAIADISVPISPSMDAVLSGGAGVQFANYSETEDAFNVSGKSTGFGFQGAVGLDYHLTDRMSLTTSFGYRQAKLDDFSNDVHFFQPSNPPVELDFSGIFTRAGVKIRF